MEYNVLALAHLHKLHKNYNRIFEDWCEGIRANSGNYHFMDYVELYSDIGKKAFEEHVEGFMEEKKIDCVFIAFYSGDLTLDMNFLERLSKRSFLVMGFLTPNIISRRLTGIMPSAQTWCFCRITFRNSGMNF